MAYKVLLRDELSQKVSAQEAEEREVSSFRHNVKSQVRTMKIALGHT